MWDLDLYARLDMADAWAIIGPINWYSVSSNLKLMFDRLVCFTFYFADIYSSQKQCLRIRLCVFRKLDDGRRAKSDVCRFYTNIQLPFS